MNHLPPQTVKDEWNMACPECGADDRIDIGAIVYVRLCIDGTDIAAAENGDHEWDGDSSALCWSCGHAATVRDFTINERGQA